MPIEEKAGQLTQDFSFGFMRDTPPAAGWSLRLQQPLTADEVERTDAMLQRIGIDLPVAGGQR